MYFGVMVRCIRVTENLPLLFSDDKLQTLEGFLAIVVTVLWAFAYLLSSGAPPLEVKRDNGFFFTV